MPQSLAKLLTPIVFSPKDRYPYLDAAVRPELHAYAATVLQGCDSPAITINSVTDHIHLVCALSRKWRLCDVVEELKVGTSKGIKTKGGMLPKFHWQNGYAAFSVSESMLARVKEYIAKQEEHHRRRDFQDEFRELLRRHGIEFDERYVWD